MSDNLFYMIKAVPRDKEDATYEEIPLINFLKDNVSIDESIQFFHDCYGSFDFDAIVDVYGTYQDLYNDYISSIADTIADEIDACDCAEWFDYTITFVYED